MHRFIYAVASVSFIALASAQESDVSVCVRFSSSVNLPIVSFGKNIAARIFEPTGVRLQWTCRPPAANGVIVEIKRYTPEEFHRGALAYALPFAHDGVRVVLLYDRLEAYLPASISSAGAFFGAVLAHEIAHVIESLDRHAATGVMKGRWTDDDFASIEKRSFTFSAEDTDLIRAGIRRADRLQSTFARHAP